jgi:DNA (cytosine-5)-methyltransferase 1
MGYDAEWGVLGAHDAKAPHKRDRIWIVGTLADATQLQRNGSNHHTRISLEGKSVPESGDGCWTADVADANLPQCHRVRCAIRSDSEHTYANASSSWWRQDPAEAFESNVGRMANGVASRVDRLKAIGNGQVSIVAALAFKILSARLNINKNNK